MDQVFLKSLIQFLLRDLIQISLTIHGIHGSQIIYPYFDKLYRINNDGSGLTKIYQTSNGKFISECDWSNDGAKSH
jgi:hypothetical protein